MKPKKIYLSVITLLLLACSMPACKKSFLELTPQGVIPVTSYYATEIDIKTALTGIYSSLRPIYNSQWAFGELPSDNSQTYAESEGSWGEEDKLTWTSASPFCRRPGPGTTRRSPIAICCSTVWGR